MILLEGYWILPDAKLPQGPLLSVFVPYLNYPLVRQVGHSKMQVSKTGFIQFNSCNPHLLATFWAPGKVPYRLAVGGIKIWICACCAPPWR